MAMRCVFIWREHFVVASGGIPQQTNLDVLMGVRWLANDTANKFWNAVLGGLAIFFLLSGLRYLMRRDWLVAAVAAILLTLQEGLLRNSTHPYLDYPLQFAVYAAFGIVLLRMGLVPTIIGIFIVNLSGSVPIGGDASAWYNPTTFVELCLVAGIAIYGFWRSQSADPGIQLRGSEPGSASD
jgi:dolichyl-phosphate-mannose--protein O-mannosyl transferase